MKFIQQKILVLFFWVVAAHLMVAQDVKVMTHHFYFDTNVHNRLTKGSEINFTAQDDGWLNGRIKSIEVIGYADCRGDAEKNLILSRNRAFFITKKIVELGVVSADFPVECTAQGELPCGDMEILLIEKLGGWMW